MVTYSLVIKFFTFMVISIILAVILYVLPFLVNYQVSVSGEKLSSYECGFEPFNDSKGTFSTHFYIVGVLYIIFDLEIVYLIPWSKNLYIIGYWGFWVVILFLVVLAVGFIYEWKKGALNWSNFYIREG